MQSHYSSIDDMQVLALKNAMGIRRKIQSAVFDIPQDFRTPTHLSSQYQRRYLEVVNNTLPQQDSVFINLFLDYFQQESHVNLSAKQEALNQAWEDNPLMVKTVCGLSGLYPKSQQAGQNGAQTYEELYKETQNMKSDLEDRFQEITEEEWEHLTSNNATLQQLTAKIQQQTTPSNQDMREFAERATRTLIQSAQDICQNLEVALQQSHAVISSSSIAHKREARMDPVEQTPSSHAHPI